MSGDIADDYLGLEKPKAKPAALSGGVGVASGGAAVPAGGGAIAPAFAPTLDEAAERQTATDRLKYRTGRKSTRFGAALASGKLAGFKLLGASR